jgi:tetratricopeptide (TPR) repeat protein
MARWWGQPDAPTDLMVLQAPVEQSRHEFSAARATLQRALQTNPAHAQGWLTLATLERVAARYAESEAACRNVARYGAALYATACLLENKSLQGQHDAARKGFTALTLQLDDSQSRAWVLSLLAESEERAGRDDAADAAYRRSLADASDGYTAVAYADLLLRRSRSAEAIDVLKGQPDSDGVLLRRAHAMRLIDDGQWQVLKSDLQGRYAAISARGEALDTHARERALLALWLQGDPADAWRAAQTNLALQKEPLDWWLALKTSEQSGDASAHQTVRQALLQSGLKDARLARWQTEGAR